MNDNFLQTLGAVMCAGAGVVLSGFLVGVGLSYLNGPVTALRVFVAFVAVVAFVGGVFLGAISSGAPI